MKTMPISVLVLATGIMLGGYYLQSRINTPSDSISTDQKTSLFSGQSTKDPAQDAILKKPASNPHDELQAYKSEVNAKLAMLASEVTALRHQLQDQAMRDDPQASSEDETNRNVRNDPNAQSEVEGEYKELMVAKENEFRQEPSDGQWAPQTSSRLREVMDKNPAMRDAVRNIECKSTTCRVELAVTEQVSASKSLDNLVTQIGDTLPQVTYNQVDDGNGEVTTVLYMSRIAAQPPQE
ncbi:MAG: hypothetical protein PHO08_04195 [Methylococcales bacterium]|nr:hypothetical protein [Methylococcales bacterium]